MEEDNAPAGAGLDPVDRLVQETMEPVPAPPRYHDLDLEHDGTIEGVAVAAAHLVHDVLSWDDARMALLRGTQLLRQWEREESLRAKSTNER